MVKRLKFVLEFVAFVPKLIFDFICLLCLCHHCAMLERTLLTRFLQYQALIRSRSGFRRHYCSSQPESWSSMEGLLRCSANDVPLSPIGFLERSSVAYGDATCLVYGSLTHTWAHTHQRCLKLASALSRHLGISRGDVVATFSHNLPGIYELHFAVPMAGAVLCTLNARYDASMVSILLSHSEAKVLFVDPQLLQTASRALELIARTDRTKPPVLVLLADPESGLSETGADSNAYEYEELVEMGSDGFEIRRPRSEWDPISINYTSGTTSRPKGVVYSHRGAYLNSLATVLLHNMGARPVYLWTVPMFHCNGWCLPWGSAAQGATNVCVRKVSPKVIFDNIAAHGVTHMGGVPTVLNSIVNSPAEDRKPLPHAVDILTGGSPPPPQIMAKMEELGFRVNHIYGLTEVFGPGTNCVVKPEWDELPIEEQYRMRARQGVRHLGLEDVDVRDPVTMKSIPADGKTMGEVMFRGNTVMSGYLKDKKATEEAFKGGWFRSGDLAVKHPDHYIQLKDRMKDVIISGGENISTIDVETVLYSHEAVLEAAVVGRPDNHWGETPCAFVTLKEGFHDRISADEIIAFCRDRLPRYMAPRSVVFSELPKTSTGKIQKFVLKERAKTMGSL